MQRGELNGSYVMPAFCEVGYSATLASQGHNLKGYLHWGKVLAEECSECTIKWQMNKKTSSHSIPLCFLLVFGRGGLVNGCIIWKRHTMSGCMRWICHIISWVYGTH